ncbi:MAG: hypothetical protein J5767_13335 [Paludibacteraceae bacterium]|nr:hypothetical protein [Paludibacteraceae bacterium]
MAQKETTQIIPSVENTIPIMPSALNFLAPFLEITTPITDITNAINNIISSTATHVGNASGVILNIYAMTVKISCNGTASMNPIMHNMFFFSIIPIPQ